MSQALLRGLSATSSGATTDPITTTMTGAAGPESGDYYNTDNFWSVDPLILAEHSRSLMDETVAPPAIFWSGTGGKRQTTSCASPLAPPPPLQVVIPTPSRQQPRRLPIHFLDAKDWPLYMEFATAAAAATTTIRPSKNRKNNKVHRLLSAFYNLYQEYAELNDDYERLRIQRSGPKSNSTDSMSSEEIGAMQSGTTMPSLRSGFTRSGIYGRPVPVPLPEMPNLTEPASCLSSVRRSTTESATQTLPSADWSELSEQQLTELMDCGAASHTVRRWNIAGIGNKRSATSTSASASSSYVDGAFHYPGKARKMKMYDQLTRHNFLGAQSVDVLEEVTAGQPQIWHRMNLVASPKNELCSHHSSEFLGGPLVAGGTTGSCSQGASSSSFIFNSIATALRCATSSHHSQHSQQRSSSGNNSNTLAGTAPAAGLGGFLATGDCNSGGSGRLVRLPVLLELALPKVQAKVRYVLHTCPFLSSPLEVVAELRACNYNKTATVHFFRQTRQLRGSLREFLGPSVEACSRQAVLRALCRDAGGGDTACSNCGRALLRHCDEAAEQHNRGDYEDEDEDTTDTRSPLPMSIGDSGADKATHIEPGIFDNAVQDSYTQTLLHTPTLPGEYPQKETPVSLPPSSSMSSSSLLSHAALRQFGNGVSHNLSYLKRAVRETRTQVGHLRRQVSSLLRALRNNIELIISLSSKHLISDQHRGRIVLLARQVEELKLKLKDEETKRRLVYNLMQEQMGNVRVYCRCRDVPPHNESVIEVQDCESIVLPILPQERFDFDKVFPASLRQADIYEEFRPLVMSFIDGFNVCFITYGSEASGKTYTLIGGCSNNCNGEAVAACSGGGEHGIMQRALNTLLTEQRARNRDWDYQIAACLVEIYNDNCIDLLSGETGIQLYVDCGMESVYQKLKSVPITSETDAEVLVQLCRVKRKVARTALNPASSRSHLITLIRLQGRSKIHGENIRSFMCLCDLAGFEDIIKAETQSNKTLSKEAGYINRSLTAFNRVFVSLRRQDPNTVCYRDTKLTHLLKPFLTNSGKCALIITIRTDRRSLSSTQNTLRFGRETRGVSLGKARRQVNN